jgi:hypothetical protein
LGPHVQAPHIIISGWPPVVFITAGAVYACGNPSRFIVVLFKGDASPSAEVW